MHPSLTDLAPERGWQPVDPDRTGPLTARRGCLYPVTVLALRALGRKQVPELFLTLLRTPRLLVPWSWLGSRLMPYGRLDPLERERVILRVAWNCRCRYEWMQHLEIGLLLGLTEADIRRVTEGPAAQPTARLRALLDAADAFHADRRVGDQTWRALRAELDDERMLELLMLLSHYEGLAGLLNSVAVRPEQEVIDKIAKAIGDTA